LPRIPDIAIVSPATTLGWRYSDRSLARLLEEIGCSCEVVPIRMGPTAGLRRRMTVTDAVEALAARRTAGHVRGRALILSSITAALLQSPRRRYAIRFDSLAVLSRPGVGGAWQRRREPSALAQADLLLPCSAIAAKTARELLLERPAPPLVTLPIPIEPVPSSPNRDLDLIAYAGNPAKRGLDLLCRAWDRAAVAGAQLIVGGIDAGEATRWLRRHGQDQPPQHGRLELLHHDEGGEQLADLAGVLRVLLDVLRQRRPFAAAVALGKLVGNTLQRVVIGLGRSHKARSPRSARLVGM